MKNLYIVFFFGFIISGCSVLNSGGLSVQDRTVRDIGSQLQKSPGDSALQQNFVGAYNSTVRFHLNNISSLERNASADSWENVIDEYSRLNALTDFVNTSPQLNRLVIARRYDGEIQMTRENAADNLYARAKNLLNNGDRRSAMEAARLLNRVNDFIPGYRDSRELMKVADNRSILTIVINPVNYYSHNYNYYGLNNDYVQYQFINDLRYQLSAGRDVRVLSDREAMQSELVPDRVVDMTWDELYMPVPIQNSFTREVSKQIVVGKDKEGRNIYETVHATLFITQRTIQARGTLSCRITDPMTGAVLLYQNFPGGYNHREESATYRGDRRALSAYDWSMINRSGFNELSRYNLFQEVLRQVYPQLLNRIKSVTWYS